MRRNGFWIGLFELPQKPHPFLTASGDPQKPALIRQYRGRIWVKRLGAANLVQRLIEAADRLQISRVPVVGGGIVGIEIDGAAKFLIGGSRVPHPVEGDEGERRVRLRGMIVELHSLLGRRERARV